MADTFRAELAARIGWTWKATTGMPKDVDEVAYAKALTDGCEQDEAEAKWSSEDATILSGESTTLDLTALTRTVFGDTLTTVLVSVKALLVVNSGTTGGEIVIGDADSNEWSEPFGADGDTIKVPLDSAVFLSNRHWGWPVDDSNKNLKLAASGGDVTYSIVIVGTETENGSGSSSG